MKFKQVTIFLPLFCVACTAVPKDGPGAGAVLSGAETTVDAGDSNLQYVVVNLSPATEKIANGETLSNAQSFASLRRGDYSNVRIGVGDTLGVTIFESQSGGLFIPQEAGARNGNYISLPNQEVDASGKIAVPYAGEVVAAGRTAKDISQEIEHALAKRAIEPKVVVSIGERRANTISVLGDVNLPARFPLEAGGIHLLSAIARSGGPKYPAYETVVSVQRAGRVVRMPLSAIVRDPRQDVQLAPNDVVYVAREPKTYLLLGSTPSPGSIGGTNDRRFSFDDDNMSLSEAVAKGGGLDPTRADSTEVFLYRREPRAALEAMGVDVSNFRGSLIPTIYRANWSQGDVFFLASNFYVRDKDVLFVSEHPVSDFLKFSSFIRGFTLPASDIGTAAGGISTASP